MSRSERRKGVEGEREVARILRAAGLDALRVPNSGGLRWKGDITGVNGFHFEVKRQEVARFPLWLRQAWSECGELEPVVVWRQSREAWTATLPLYALARLLALASACERGEHVGDKPPAGSEHEHEPGDDGAVFLRDG